ncbi:MAG: hypothetical protein M3Y08_07275 [Fibrobacterota bacterium]|nr:hypothetical protein [Fibrobacterota bacterium]
MDKKSPADKAANASDKPTTPAKKAKQSIDPAQRKPGGFDRSILKGKAPIFRTMKKSGR